MNRKIVLKPIGIIYTPYKEPKGMPIQGTFEQGVIGTIRLLPKYRPGLKDVENFSHLILIYYFNRSSQEKLVAKPFIENKKHGIFAIRSPQRPNHIGFSIVKLMGINNNIITFSEVDILDGTPLLDIKPYVKYFDKRNNVKSGWIDKNFKNGKIPKKTKI